MPIYEYGCKKCGNEWELMQKISDKAPSTCPSCRSKRVEKLMSLGAFSLKGGGWYADGYADNTKKSASASDSASSTKAKAKAKTDNTSKS